MLVDLSVHDFLAKLATPAAPGSGSAAALSGAMGVSILEMTARLGSASLENTVAAESVLTKLAQLHRRLEALIERDAEALAAALPALTAVGPDGDSAEWNDALLQAIEVPFAIAAACGEALGIARILIAAALPHIRCDMQFAAMSCHIGLQGALALAELNISLLRDDRRLQEELNAKVNGILAETEQVMDRILV